MTFGERIRIHDDGSGMIGILFETLKQGQVIRKIGRTLLHKENRVCTDDFFEAKRSKGNRHAGLRIQKEVDNALIVKLGR